MKCSRAERLVHKLPKRGEGIMFHCKHDLNVITDIITQQERVRLPFRGSSPCVLLRKEGV